MLLTLDEFELIKDRLEKEEIRKIANEVGVSEEQVRIFFNLSDQSQSAVYVKKGIHGSYVRMDDPAIFEAACRHLNFAEVLA